MDHTYAALVLAAVGAYGGVAKRRKKKRVMKRPPPPITGEDAATSLTPDQATILSIVWRRTSFIHSLPL